MWTRCAGSQQVVFKVEHLKVHRGWAWIVATPLDRAGRPLAEGGPSLLHYERGRWNVVDLSAVAEDPDDPLADQDATPVYIRHVQQKYPGVPADIFPRRTH